MAVKVNDEIGRYFQTKKCVRQGDPMLPILFNIVVDMLAIFIERAKNDGQISGIIPNLVESGLSILQYAGDTILLMDHDIQQATNLKLLPCVFEQLSSLKINFHKSELYCFGEAKEYESQYTQLFGCGVGSFSFRYLDIPIHYHKLLNKDWKGVEDCFEKNLSSWKGRHLSTVVI